MPKNTVAEIGYGFFDQPDTQSLNNYRFDFFVMRLQFQTIGGVQYTGGKVFKTFPTVH
jgi:hypothetical protein